MEESSQNHSPSKKASKMNIGLAVIGVLIVIVYLALVIYPKEGSSSQSQTKTTEHEKSTYTTPPPIPAGLEWLNEERDKAMKQLFTVTWSNYSTTLISTSSLLTDTENENYLNVDLIKAGIKQVDEDFSKVLAGEKKLDDLNKEMLTVLSVRAPLSIDRTAKAMLTLRENANQNISLYIEANSKLKQLAEFAVDNSPFSTDQQTEYLSLQNEYIMSLKAISEAGFGQETIEL